MQSEYVWAAKQLTSARSSPLRLSASGKSTTTSNWSALWIVIWDTSVWRLACRSRWKSLPPKSATHVAGTLCNPCVRVGPSRKWRALAASRNFGLLFGGKVFDDLPFLGAILRLMQSVIEGRQFDVWLEPVRILFDDNLQITQSGFVLP